MWAEKKKRYTLFVHAQLIFGIFYVKSIRYTNLRKTCRLFLPEKCLPLTTLCVDDDKGAIKGNKLYRNYPCSRAFQLNAMAHD